MQYSADPEASSHPRVGQFGFAVLIALVLMNAHAELQRHLFLRKPQRFALIAQDASFGVIDSDVPPSVTVALRRVYKRS